MLVRKHHTWKILTLGQQAFEEAREYVRAIAGEVPSKKDRGKLHADNYR
jgi:hypothetical protein